MHLLPEEPAARGWRPTEPADLLARLLDGVPAWRPAVLAVDGRSGSGKTTTAHALAAAGGGTVLSTDDVAWNHSRFGWHERLVRHVLHPVAAGRPVAWRPAEWPDDKAGAVRVAAPVRLVVVEGVGAGDRLLAPHVDRLLWVQSDLRDAEARGLARDVALGRSPAEARRFWDEWAAEEVPYLAGQRPWDRADAVVLGGGGGEGALLVGARPGGGTRQ